MALLYKLIATTAVFSTLVSAIPAPQGSVVLPLVNFDLGVPCKSVCTNLQAVCEATREKVTVGFDVRTGDPITLSFAPPWSVTPVTHAASSTQHDDLNYLQSISRSRLCQHL
jgi:hypothetical protein